MDGCAARTASVAGEGNRHGLSGRLPASRKPTPPGRRGRTCRGGAPCMLRTVRSAASGLLTSCGVACALPCPPTALPNCIPAALPCPALCSLCAPAGGVGGEVGRQHRDGKGVEQEEEGQLDGGPALQGGARVPPFIHRQLRQRGGRVTVGVGGPTGQQLEGWEYIARDWTGTINLLG